MYLTAYIERLGTGTTDILDFAKNANLPEPKFIQEDMFRTIIYRTNTKQETVGETVEKILHLIKLNPKVTRQELSTKIGLSVRGIEWNLKKMKENGLLKRVGSTKNGYWEVINREDKT